MSDDLVRAKAKLRTGVIDRWAYDLIERLTVERDVAENAATRMLGRAATAIARAERAEADADRAASLISHYQATRDAALTDDAYRCQEWRVAHAAAVAERDNR